MSVNKCACCGIPIAEDRQVCNLCENGWKTNTDKAFDIQTGIEIQNSEDAEERLLIDKFYEDADKGICSNRY